MANGDRTKDRTSVARWRLDADGRRLQGARYCASPYCDERPGGTADIDTLVIHAISLPPGEYGGGWIARLFTDCVPPEAHPYFATLQGLEVSAHLCIYRDGSADQFVDFGRRAWHAGVSRFDGRERVNDFSIGIELEGCDEDDFTDAQYRSLVEIMHAVRQRYPRITPERIVGHSDIAPGRKTDPGPHFDWARLKAGLP